MRGILQHVNEMQLNYVRIMSDNRAYVHQSVQAMIAFTVERYIVSRLNLLVISPAAVVCVHYKSC